jgi:hypothetical protein
MSLYKYLVSRCSPLLKQSANVRECIKLPVVDVIFLAVYRWSKAIEYFLPFALLNTCFAALNILWCNLLNSSDVVLNISVIIEYKTFIEYFKSVLNINCVY